MANRTAARNARHRSVMTSTYDDLVDRLERAFDAGPVDGPVAFADQLQAAMREAGLIVEGMAASLAAHPVTPLRSSMIELDNRARARWTAGALRCRPCVHIRQARGPFPMFADLGIDLVRCVKCSVTFRASRQDNRCELCLSDGHDPTSDFREAMQQVGPILIGANLARRCCWDLLPPPIASVS